MTFQAYIETIRQKTGLGPKDFVRLAAEKGLNAPGTTATQIIDWLKADYGLGRGHAMAIVHTLKAAETGGRGSKGERINKLFAGGKAKWRDAYERLLAELSALGTDIGTAPTDSYVSFLRGGKKFAILQPAGARLDIGIKRKGAPPTSRFALAGTWNAMVTHRVRVTAASEIDAEVMEWLQAAYDAG